MFLKNSLFHLPKQVCITVLSHVKRLGLDAKRTGTEKRFICFWITAIHWVTEAIYIYLTQDFICENCLCVSPLIQKSCWNQEECPVHRRHYEFFDYTHWWQSCLPHIKWLIKCKNKVRYLSNVGKWTLWTPTYLTPAGSLIITISFFQIVYISKYARCAYLFVSD